MAVVCISRNTGGTRTLLRVAEEFRRSGEDVFFLAQADSAAERVLTEACEPIRNVASIDDILRFVEWLRPRTVLISWCAEIGRAAIPILNERRILTALVEDTWWHGGALDSLPKGRRPTFVCVGTENDRQRVLAAWFGYPVKRVQVTGWPAFDWYAGLDVSAIGKEVREELDLLEDWPVVFLGIDDLPSSGQMVADFVDALNEIDQPVYLIPGFHPAFDRRVPEERPVVEEALVRFKSGTLVDRGTVETTRLVATADVVAAMFSPILAEAACLRRQVIAVLYPDTGQQFMQAEIGAEEYPLVSLGCAVRASDRNELREFLEQALGRGLGLEDAQRQNFKLDGLNSRRIARLS